MNIHHFGTLYIVATPIGHLKDITLRAIEILKTVDLIAAEDTRHSGLLLKHYSITTPVLSLHEFNEKERSGLLIKKLEKGESIALITDAGTPLISDPGFFLVKKAREKGIKVVPIPGVCALIAALSASGLSTERFIFEGFLPAKSKARLDRLNELASESRTLIFYEAPHRILDTLQDMKNIFGEKRIGVIARELTRKFETIYSDTFSNLIDWIEKNNQERGEFVVLVEGNTSPDPNISSENVLKLLLAELPLKKAVDIAVKITGGKKNELYELALGIKNNL